MVDRKQLENLVAEMNKADWYSWLVTDKEGRVTGVGSQWWTGAVLDVLTAAEKMRAYLGLS
jgi:hypothetical protein